ncbi:hypothetical protein GPROT2_00864 [Gammaproteobacteria bacterium]|nr:hypothetical protein GPROT2_00864 [Gammaproteobacteria bacterium]
MNAWGALADAVLLVHAAFVAFVVIGQVLVLAGLAFGWRWVRGRRLRIAHLAAIGVVVAQAWAGVLCPLTVLENALRARAGEGGYGGSFIAHWLHRLIFFDAPMWVFTVAYTAFGLLVAATWYWGGPRR